MKAGPDLLTPPMPLRCALAWDMADMLMDRVLKISNAQQTDELWKATVAHCKKRLVITPQESIGMARMLKYMEQLQAVTQDSTAIIKFHALKQAEGQVTVPWLLQMGMRHDEAHTLFWTLQGSTVWSLIGASTKPHSLHLSRQGQLLQEALGKGQAKGKKPHSSHRRPRAKARHPNRSLELTGRTPS